MLRLFLAAALVAAIAAPVFAVPTITLTNPNGGNNGFKATVTSETVGIYSTNDTFWTFCVEYDEHFTPGGTYSVYVNTAAVYGGVGSSTSDPLGADTAWLYDQFLDEVLGINVNSSSEMFKLQQAIWQLEGEITTQTASNNIYIKLVEDNESEWLNKGIGDIRVMNLWTTYQDGVFSGRAQDQLVRISPVPVPGALLLGSMGMGIVGWLRRRRTL